MLSMKSNPRIELIEKWIECPASVTPLEMEDNKKAAYADWLATDGESDADAYAALDAAEAAEDAAYAFVEAAEDANTIHAVVTADAAAFALTCTDGLVKRYHELTKEK